MPNGLRKLFKNDYVFSVFSRIVSFVIGLLYSVLFSRYLQAELRGVSSVILNYAELTMLFLCLGINQGYPYFRKKDSENAYKEYCNIVFAFFIFYLLSGIVLIFALHINIEVSTIIILIPFLFLIKELNYVVMVENPSERNKSAILLSFFDVVFVLFFFVFIPASYTVCLIFIIIKEVIYALEAIRRLHIKLLDLRPSFKGAKKYLIYGFFPMLTVIMMEINYKSDVLMLEAFHVDNAKIGVYTLAVSLAQKIWLIPDAMKDILVSNLAKGRDKDEVVKVNRLSFWIVVVISIFFLFIGAPIIDFLYGAGYEGTYLVIALLLVGVLGMIFYKNVYSYNVVFGKRIINLVLLSIAAGSNVIINLILIPKYHIYGAAVASSVSYLICGIAFLIYFCCTTKTSVLQMIILKKQDLMIVRRFFNRGDK